LILVEAKPETSESQDCKLKIDKEKICQLNEDCGKNKDKFFFSPITLMEKEYKGIKRYGGMLLTVGASICFSFVTLLVKYLQGYGVDAYGSSFWR
jgi:hypothetical protein